MRSEQEGNHLLLADQIEEQSDNFRFLRQLLKILSFEFFPFLWVMTEPFPKIRTCSRLLQGRPLHAPVSSRAAITVRPVPGIRLLPQAGHRYVLTVSFLMILRG